MKRAIGVTALTTLLTLAVLAGCVTVNVYFPAAEAQKAADRIIDQVTGSTGAPPAQDSRAKPQSAPAGQPPSAHRSTFTTSGSALLAATGRVLALIVPAAAAQEQANLHISTPQIRAIIASMHQRFQSLRPFFASVPSDSPPQARSPSAMPARRLWRSARRFCAWSHSRTATYRSSTVK